MLDFAGDALKIGYMHALLQRYIDTAALDGVVFCQGRGGREALERPLAAILHHLRP